MNNDWEQETSDIYRQLAQIAVPARAEQIATLLSLIPFDASEAFRVVELASGEGYLSRAIADAFPEASILALDFEASMREATQARLGERATVVPFDIRSRDWFDLLDHADVVVSSLCIHHLDGAEKQILFRAVAERLSTRGTFLIADIIAPKTAQSNRLFASVWDRMAKAHNRSDLFEAFQKTHWNLFHYPEPDFDKPSPLFEQLTWLQAAGFPLVDCFWMQAGHAIYGGYHQPQAGGVDYDSALAFAEKVLGA